MLNNKKLNSSNRIAYEIIGYCIFLYFTIFAGTLALGYIIYDTYVNSGYNAIIYIGLIGIAICRFFVVVNKWRFKDQINYLKRDR